MTPATTEDLLRETLGALAQQVEPSPTAYKRAAAKWRHREQRRRLYVAIFAGLLIVIADILGLWALNHATSEEQMLWDEPAPADAPALHRPVDIQSGRLIVISTRHISATTGKPAVGQRDLSYMKSRPVP
jgi:hypothetical protein